MCQNLTTCNLTCHFDEPIRRISLIFPWHNELQLRKRCRFQFSLPGFVKAYDGEGVPKCTPWKFLHPPEIFSADAHGCRDFSSPRLFVPEDEKSSCGRFIPKTFRPWTIRPQDFSSLDDSSPRLPSGGVITLTSLYGCITPVSLHR